jgi:hypothetical protein
MKFLDFFHFLEVSFRCLDQDPEIWNRILIHRPSLNPAPIRNRIRNTGKKLKTTIKNNKKLTTIVCMKIRRMYDKPVVILVKEFHCKLLAVHNLWSRGASMFFRNFCLGSNIALSFNFFDCEITVLPVLGCLIPNRPRSINDNVEFKELIRFLKKKLRYLTIVYALVKSGKK